MTAAKVSSAHITFGGVKCVKACETALVRVVTPEDHRHSVPGRQDNRVPRSVLISFLSVATETQSLVCLGQHLV